jgi:hypothetical protein
MSNRKQIWADDTIYDLIQEEKLYLEKSFPPKKFSYQEALRSLIFNNKENRNKFLELKNFEDKLKNNKGVFENVGEIINGNN